MDDVNKILCSCFTQKQSSSYEFIERKRNLKIRDYQHYGRRFERLRFR